MKQKENRQYKIALTNGVIYLNRGEIKLILARRFINTLSGFKDSKDMQMGLLFPPRERKKHSVEELILEVQDCFTNPQAIKEVINRQKEELDVLISLLGKKDKKLAQMLKKEWVKTGIYKN